MTAMATTVTAARPAERTEIGHMLGMSAPISIVRAFGGRARACGGIARALGWGSGKASPDHVKVARRDGKVVAACVRCDGSERGILPAGCEGIPEKASATCARWVEEASCGDEGAPVVVPMFAVGSEGCRNGAAEALLMSVIDEAGDRPVEVEVPLGDDYAVIACLSLGFRTVRGSAGDGDGIVRMRMG